MLRLNNRQKSEWCARCVKETPMFELGVRTPKVVRKVEGVDETLRPFTACDASLRMDHRPPVERQPHRLVALQFENASQDLRQGHRSVHACTAVDPNIERSWGRNRRIHERSDRLEHPVPHVDQVLFEDAVVDHAHDYLRVQP